MESAKKRKAEQNNAEKQGNSSVLVLPTLHVEVTAAQRLDSRRPNHYSPTSSRSMVALTVFQASSPNNSVPFFFAERFKKSSAVRQPCSFQRERDASTAQSLAESTATNAGTAAPPSKNSGKPGLGCKDWTLESSRRSGQQKTNPHIKQADVV